MKQGDFADLFYLSKNGFEVKTSGVLKCILVALNLL